TSYCRGRNGDHSPPPAQIRTYSFPISGSCLRSAAKADRRIGMTDDSRRNPSLDVALHAIPRDVALLTAATQPLLPEPNNQGAQGTNSATVQRDSVIVQLSANKRAIVASLL